MKILHDNSWVRPDDRQLVEYGYAAEDLYNLRLSYVPTPEEAEKARRQCAEQENFWRTEEWASTALAHSEELHQVMETIAEKFLCYQYGDDSELPYDGELWDLFFWCNCFFNTAHGTNLTGRDYRYITLSFNEKRSIESRKATCDGVLDLLQAHYADNPHLEVAVQHQLQLDHKRIKRDIQLVLPELMKQPFQYGGMEGRLVKTDCGAFFMKKYAKKYGYPISDTTLLRTALERGLKVG